MLRPLRPRCAPAVPRGRPGRRLLLGIRIGSPDSASPWAATMSPTCPPRGEAPARTRQRYRRHRRSIPHSGELLPHGDEVGTHARHSCAASRYWISIERPGDLRDSMVPASRSAMALSRSSMWSSAVANLSLGGAQQLVEGHRQLVGERSLHLGAYRSQLRLAHDVRPGGGERVGQRGDAGVGIIVEDGRVTAVAGGRIRRIRVPSRRARPRRLQGADPLGGSPQLGNVV